MPGKCPEIFLIGLSHQPLRNPDMKQMLKKPMMTPMLSYKTIVSLIPHQLQQSLEKLTPLKVWPLLIQLKNRLH